MRWKKIPKAWRDPLIDWIGTYLRNGVSARQYCKRRGLNYNTGKRYLNAATRNRIITTWMNAKG